MENERKPIKAVAFDMDGLMFDTEAVYWRSADRQLRRRGFRYTEELCNEIMGRPPQFCFEKFKEVFSFPETWQELQKESETIFLEELKNGYRSMPGLFELLDKLEEKHIPKAICTSSARRILEAVLERDHLLPRFAFTITAENIVHGKPDPEIYRKAAYRFGLSNENMLVLEDSLAGVNSALSSGSSCCVIIAEHNRHLTFPQAAEIHYRLNDPAIMELFEY